MTLRLEGMELSLEMREVIPCQSLAAWREVYLSSLLILIKLHGSGLLTGKLIKKDVMNLATICYNLGRKYHSTQKLLLSSKMAVGIDRINTNYLFANMLLNIKQYTLSNVLFETCLTDLNNASMVCSSMTSRITELQSKIPTTDKANTNFSFLLPLKEPGMFHNYFLFEAKVSLIDIALKQVDEKVRYRDYGYALKITRYLQKYNELSSVVLSSIVNKGGPDLQRSFDEVFEFVFTFPPTVLLKKVMSFTSIGSLVDRVIGKYPDAMFGDTLSVTNILARSELYSKNGSYMKYLTVFMKGRLYSALHDILQNQEEKVAYKEFIIISLHSVVSSCKALVELFSFTSEAHKGIKRKDLDKIKKLKSTYKNSVETFLREMGQIGIVSGIYIMYLYRISNFLLEDIKSPFCSNLKLEVIKKDVFDLRIFYCMLTNDTSRTVPSDMMDNAVAFGNELLSFYCADTIKIPTIVDKVDFRLPKRIFILQVISHYCHALETSFADDSNVCQIIQNLMRYIILCGGFHVSLIWKLSEIKQVYNMKDSTSLISWEDGTDPMLSCSNKLMDPFREELDLIIKRLCLSQCDAIVGMSHADLIKKKYMMFLPSVVIKNRTRIAFLSDGAFTGNIVSTQLSKEEGEAFETVYSNTLQEFSISKGQQIKSIMVPTKELMADYAEKSMMVLHFFERPIDREDDSEAIRGSDFRPMTAQQYIQQYQIPPRAMQKAAVWEDVQQQVRDIVQNYHAQLQPSARDHERLTERVLWKTLANPEEAYFPCRVELR